MPRFTKEERILKSSEFETVYKVGEKAFSKNFFVAWVKGEKRRIGITIRSRIGKAHIRNRIRRIVREFFRLNKDLFPIGDCVVTARGGAGNLSGEEIRAQLEGLLSGLSLRGTPLILSLSKDGGVTKQSPELKC